MKSRRKTPSGDYVIKASGLFMVAADEASVHWSAKPKASMPSFVTRDDARKFVETKPFLEKYRAVFEVVRKS
jgi:hypothetical protein